jgi:hypothetical protein
MVVIAVKECAVTGLKIEVLMVVTTQPGRSQKDIILGSGAISYQYLSKYLSFFIGCEIYIFVRTANYCTKI